MENNTKSGIYKIQNVVNGKMYVGSAVDIGKRIGQHLRSLRKDYHINPKLQHAWNKYGAASFTFSVLEFVDDKYDLLDREQFWIDHYNSSVAGYNITPTAGSLLGFKHTTDTRKKMSDAHIGLERTAEHRAALSRVNTGKKMSDESRRKMSEAKLGKKRKG